MELIAQPKFDKAPPSPARYAEPDRARWARCSECRLAVSVPFSNRCAEASDVPNCLLFAAHTVFHPGLWDRITEKSGCQNPLDDVPLLGSAALHRRVSK